MEKKSDKTKRRKKLTVHATGKKGGQATLKKYGKAHFRAIAKKRWDNKA